MVRLSTFLIGIYLLLAIGCVSLSKAPQSQYDSKVRRSSYSRALRSMYGVIEHEYPHYKRIFVSQYPDTKLFNVPALLESVDANALDCLVLGHHIDRSEEVDPKNVEQHVVAKAEEYNGIGIFPIQMPTNYMSNGRTFADAINRFDSIWLQRSRMYRQKGRVVILFGVERARIKINAEGQPLR